MPEHPDSERPGQGRPHEMDSVARAIVNAAVDPILTIDENGLVQSANPACERLFGYSPQELEGQNVNILMPSPYREEHDQYLWNYLETGDKKIIGIGREVEGRRRDGSVFPMDLAVSELRLGDRRIFTGIIHDITERKRAEEALRNRVRQQELVAALGSKALAGADLQELMDEVVALIAATLSVKYSKVLELLPGADTFRLVAGVGWLDGLIGQAVVSASRDSQAGFTLITRQPVIVDDLGSETRFSGPDLLLDHGVVSGLSVVIQGKDRPYGILGAHTTERRTFTREDIYFVQSVANVLAEAIASRRHREQAVKQESLARIGELATVVAHEIKNPIAGITGTLDVLKRRMPRESAEREITEEMLSRLRELDNTVNDILVYARPRAPAKSEVPIKMLLESALAALSDDPQFQSIEVALVGPDVTILGDPHMLKPVFFNLAINAAHAMGGKGEFRVTVKPVRAGRRCEILFEDTGPGIPEASRGRIFEPFFTTKPGGTGLGLPIARRIIELHDGEIFFECPPHGGCVFHVRLPPA